jgi:hypothetical protein
MNWAVEPKEKKLQKTPEWPIKRTDCMEVNIHAFWSFAVAGLNVQPLDPGTCCRGSECPRTVMDVMKKNQW